MGIEQDGRRGEARQAASGSGSGAEAGGVAAPAVGDGGSIRSAVQPESGRGSRGEKERESGLKESRGLNSAGMRKRRVGDDCAVAVDRRRPGDWRRQIDTEMAAPPEMRTPKGTAATAATR